MFEYVATYWNRAHEPRFGVPVSQPDDQVRKATQTNRGVVVKVVVNGSPAFKADLFRDDVILRFAEEDIFDTDKFFQLIVSHAGQEVEFEFWRDGKIKKQRVALRD